MRSQKTANIKYQARLRTYYRDYMRFCGDQSFINIKKTPVMQNGNAHTRVYFGINDKFTVCVTCAHILPIHNIQTNIDTSKLGSHYGDVLMSTMAYQITSLSIVYSTVYSGADQRKRQSSASLTFVWGIQRWPVNSPHKWPVTRKKFPFDDVIIILYPSLLTLENDSSYGLRIMGHWWHGVTAALKPHDVCIVGTSTMLIQKTLLQIDMWYHPKNTFHNT